MRTGKVLAMLLGATVSVASLSFAGSIEGTVTLKGKAPANPAIKMSNDKKCEALHKGAKQMVENYVVDGDKLQWVLVSVKDAKKGGTKPPKATIDQVGCRYVPHVLGLMVGQELEVRNSDPLMHNINTTAAKSGGFNISQPNKGMKEIRKFDKANPVFKTKCNVHKWMGAHIGVFEHPFFCVTGKDGKYKINGIPDGSYTLVFWHEKAGSKEMKVTVKGMAKADAALDVK